MEDGKSRNWISILHLFTNDVVEAEKQNRMKHELDELCVQKIEISVFQIQGRHVGWGEEGSEVANQLDATWNHDTSRSYENHLTCIKAVFLGRKTPHCSPAEMSFNMYNNMILILLIFDGRCAFIFL